MGGIEIIKIKIISIIFIIFLLATSIPVASNLKQVLNVNNFSTVFDLLDGSWVEEINGIKVLHLNGSNYNMGYQQGYYLKENISSNIRICKYYCKDYGFTIEMLLEIWKIMEKYIPKNYLFEIQGIADGAGLTYDEIGILNINHEAVNLIACCGALAWDNATTDGDLIHFRSADFSIFLKDNETGTYLQENQVLIVNTPKTGYASMYPSIAGYVGSMGGINEKGIGVGETTCFTNDTSLYGIPISIRMRMVLDTAESLDESVDIMNSNRTCGWNLFISDANISDGCILEQTANKSYICTWNDPVENKAPFFKINNVLRRANMFLSPDCVALERGYHRPNGILGLLRFFLMGDFYFVIWLHYKALSKGLSINWG